MTLSPADALCQFIPPFMRFLREGLAELNMSPARFQLLQTLKVNGAQSMIDLADRLSVTKRNVTSLVDGLEKDGLARRRSHPTDRRSTLVELMPEGEAAFAEAAKVQRRHLAELLEGIAPEQREAMAHALTQLIGALSEGRERPEKAG